MKNLKTLIILFFSFFSLFSLIFKTSSAQENPCLTCHVEFKEPVKNVHAAIALGCQTCHKAVEGKSHPDQKDSIKLTQDMPVLCYSCHNKSNFEGKSVHTPVSSGMCTGCHDAHQSNIQNLLKKEVPDLCYMCHDQSKFKGASGHTSIGMCLGCHKPHSSKFENILINSQPDLCYSCHDKAKFSKKYVHSIIPAGGCTSCHTPHISANPSLLTKATINEVCITCHRAKSDGRHIVTIPGGRRIHPVKGVPDPSTTTIIMVPNPNNPELFSLAPDPKNPGRELSCISCHDPHSSDFKKLFPSERICGRCHKEY